MAAYYKVEVSLNTNSVTVGSPSAQEVLVTLPLVGPQGATGATGASGASTWNEISGKPATFPPSAHEHQPDEVYADAAFVSQSGDSSLQIGIYLHNGTDNGRPVYESPTTGDYIWWDSNLDQWYLTSNTDVNLYYLDENADEFPWETDVVWNAIPPQTGNIEVDQAFLSDISDYGVASVIGLKTSKSGNASSTELVLGNDTRLTNSRTPSSTLAHASTHHTGGSDAVSAFSIGAESIFDATGNTLSGTPVTLAASRARVWTLICFSSTTVTLPTTGVELGDRIVLRGGSPVSATISISSTGVADTIQNADEQFSYTYLSTGIGNRWIKNLVDNHDASRVNSGTFNNARINFASPPAIGSTTPNTGAFTTLSSNVGTITASTPLAVTQTWNNSATNFRAIETNITNTTSQTESHHLACSVGGSLVAYIRRDGRIVGSGNVYGGNGLESALLPQGVAVGSASYIGFCSNTYANDVGGDLRLFRDAADTLAQRRTTNPQVFRIYNTYTNASNHERLSLRWASSVAIIGTEKGSVGGSARALEFQTDGVTRVTLGDAGGITVNSGNLVLTDNTGAETATFDAQSKLTANRTYDLPDSSGTIALLETLPAGGTKTYAVFTATDNQPPAADFATLDTRNSIAVLDFDDATDESAVFVSIIPEGASLGSGLKIRLHWMASTATSGDVVWDVSLERMVTDLDSDSFSTIASGTAAANGTSGILTVTEITLTTIDGVTAGDGYRLKVTRDANNGSDSMSGDAELVVCEVRSAA
jgi:hypothetical protein